MSDIYYDPEDAKRADTKGLEGYIF